jgi:hypothetical protein
MLRLGVEPVFDFSFSVTERRLVLRLIVRFCAGFPDSLSRFVGRCPAFSVRIHASRG